MVSGGVLLGAGSWGAVRRDFGGGRGVQVEELASRDPRPGLLVDMKPFSEVVIVWRREPKSREAGGDRRENSQEGSGGVQPLVNKLLTDS